MRKEAAKRGLDPDKWFNNVEVVTAEKIGIETTTYVRNIFKYLCFLSVHAGSRSARHATQGRRHQDEVSAAARSVFAERLCFAAAAAPSHLEDSP